MIYEYLGEGSERSDAVGFRCERLLTPDERNRLAALDGVVFTENREHGGLLYTAPDLEFVISESGEPTYTCCVIGCPPRLEDAVREFLDTLPD